MEVVRWMAMLAFLSLGPTAHGAAAQVEEPGPFLGISTGGGETPATLVDRCVDENRLRSREPSVLVELRAGFPVGPVVLETRTASVGRALVGAADCFAVSGPIYEAGARTERLRGVEARGFTATDLRVRVDGVSGLPVAAAVGGGRVWRENVPFFLAGAGLHSRGRWRGVVDVEWTTYRVPFDVVTQEWEDGAAVRLLKRDREYEWQPGWSFRVGAEYHIR